MGLVCGDDRMGSVVLGVGDGFGVKIGSVFCRELQVYGWVLGCEEIMVVRAPW